MLKCGIYYFMYDYEEIYGISDYMTTTKKLNWIL
jgi:hypothetical protein